MCLTIKNGFQTYGEAVLHKRNATIARKDRVVYKRFDDDIHRNLEWKSTRNRAVSPHQNFSYTFGDTYTTELNSTSPWIGKDRWYFYVHDGFHAYTTFERAKKFAVTKYEVVLRCVIPKGAKYFLGNDGDIVSNKIIIGLQRKDKVYGQWHKIK